MTIFQTYKKTITVFWLLISCLLTSCLTGCALFNSILDLQDNPNIEPAARPNVESAARTLTEREQLLLEAENFYKKNDFAAAQPIFIKISRFNDGAFDPVYEQALWHLAKIYEKTNQPEKAILSLDELSLRQSRAISKNKINFSLMKNHFRITNYTLTQKIKKQIDENHKTKNFTLNELYEDLLETTTLMNDNYLQADVLFLGEIQKYFVYIMESTLAPQNDELTTHLIANYEYFFSVLKKKSYSADFKKKLSIALYDQLIKFDRYEMSEVDLVRTAPLLRFTAYCEKQKKYLVERFNNDAQ